ncbi:chemotaxis response regulator protein-glutamate methylesterase [Methylophaga sp. 42_25_T18]|nr:chemotaxis response regulator protein-glutamate methylesterase [Methylophaga sp. 42_25_T18]
MATRVLIVDDSAFFRKRLSEIIATDPGLEVAGTANNGQEAIDQVIKLSPDVITMDMEMPVMDGISAVRKIMERHPIPILMLSTWTTEGAKSTLDALEAGAADFLPKRFEDLSEDQSIAHQQLCHRLHHLAKNFRGKAHVSPSLRTAPNTTIKPNKQVPSVSKKIKLVALATSTGGPVALQKVLTQLPATFPYPIILIQHMPATFTPSFAERLNNLCAINIKHADDGDVLVSGTAYLAPGGKQMLIKGNRNRQYIAIEDGPEEQTYKPCVDITLESVARICPAETLAVVLTGMGSDGRDGCKKIHHHGGTIWSQDEQSCTVYGMPMAIASAGIADRILSLVDIGQQLAEIS